MSGSPSARRRGRDERVVSARYVAGRSDRANAAIGLSDTAFTPLRVHSHGSLLYGVASPEALVARALELGYASLALADRDNLYLAVRFYQAARAEGLKPLLGCALSWRGHEALLLAVDRRGFAHLCELITRRHLEPRFDLVEALGPGPHGTLAAGLHVIVESPGLAASLLRAGVPAARGMREGGPAGLRPYLQVLR